MPRRAAAATGTLLVLLLALHTTSGAPLVLSPCDGPNSTLLWTQDTSGGKTRIALASSSSGQCIAVTSGCCFGESVRVGDAAATAACSNDATQTFGWPSAAYGPAPSSIPSLATGSDVSPAPGALVLDAAGAAYPGALVGLRAYAGPVDAAFVVSGDPTTGARLIHNASGLCLAAGPSPAALSPQLSLQPCKPAASQTPGAFFSSQLFRVPQTSSGGGGGSGAVVTSRGLCVTAEKPLGASGTWPGTAALIGATCAGGAGTPSQIFSLLANGTLSAPSFAQGMMLAVDPGNGTWPGTPVFLAPAGSATSVFTFAPSSVNASWGSLVHAPTGLCLDGGGVPFGHGCLHPAVRGLPYCDATLPLDARVADLVSRLTVEEASSQLGSGPFPEPCVSITSPIPRLDIPPHRHLVEVTSMAEQNCATPYGGNCSTSFAAGLTMAGAFNASLWRAHGGVVATEIRAMSNIGWADPSDPNGNFVTLSAHGPDVNNAGRDLRNGRIGELLSEDPFLGGVAAAEYVRGMQAGPSAGPGTVPAYVPAPPPGDGAGTAQPLWMVSSVKHFAFYELETNRFGSKVNVSLFDAWDSFLPQFEPAMTTAMAAGTMCSYASASIAGATTPAGAFVPACADEYILVDVVREFWGRPDATHLSDCGAVWAMASANDYTPNNLTLAAAAALNGGMDINSNTIVPAQLPAALAGGLVSEATVRAAASRLFANRFRTGAFDPLERTPPALLELGADDIGRADSRAVADDGIAQGLVLVRNDNGTLPLRRGLRLAVVGPSADSVTAVIGDFYGNTAGLCPSGNPDDCVVTVAAALAAENVGGTTVTFAGVGMASGNDTSWGQAIAAVASSDAVVLALGTDRSVAGEGSDRTEIGLPGLQGAFGVAILAAAARAGVPVVLLLVHNLPVSFDELVVEERNATYAPVSAIVDAWAPTTGARVVASALFGGVNRWGKSTLTVFPKAWADVASLYSFDMAAAPGRSYRYYDGSVGPALIEFGEGMSYTTFHVSCACVSGCVAAAAAAVGGAVAVAAPVSLSCNVTNAAGPDGDEVLLVYHRPSGDIVGRVAGAHPLPLKSLVAFERVSVTAGATASVNFNLDPATVLPFVNDVGASVLYAGQHFLDVSNGNGVNVTFSVEWPGREGEWKTVVRQPPVPRR
jgi:xylan 1,4-beta-xylosidase